VEDAVNEEQVLARARRILEKRLLTTPCLENPNQVQEYLTYRVGHMEQEVFGVIFLSTRHQILSMEEMFYGTIDSATVHPREVVKRALALNAAAVILYHCHPSGIPEPSASDQAITRRLKDALALVDMRILDHIVVGNLQCVSMAERGLV